MSKPTDAQPDCATDALRSAMVRARRQSHIDVKQVVATEAFLLAIPKTDLHVHLDGSMRLGTLIELAKEQGVELPSTDEAELRRTVFKPQYDSLEEYLKGFMYLTAVMQSAAPLERVSYEFAIDNYEEGVRYFEVRFAPQLHASADAEFGIRQVIAAVDRGLRRARDEFNERLQKSGLDEPLYEYGIIVCAMRSFFPGMSRYYTALLALHAHEPADFVSSMASTALVHASVVSRDEDQIPVVAIDIAGCEQGFEATVHKEAFELAHRHFIDKTVHAGEGYGPESINQAVRDLHAERIGHGFYLFEKDMIKNERNLGKDGGERFLSSLVKRICDHRITLEVCLTSNLNTMPELKLKDHAMKKMLAHHVAVTLNTDNRLVSNTTVTKDIRSAIDAFDLSPKQLKDIVVNGFKRSFFPGSYEERRCYVRKVMDYYDRLAVEHGVA